MIRVFMFSLSLTATISMAENVLPHTLDERLVRGDRITLIDIRPTVDYAEGHIPGAINIPAGGVASRRLPPIGEVVVYGDGLARTDAEAAVAELNEKPGIRAVALLGGLAAWESAGLATTAPTGIVRQEAHVITYQQLIAANQRELLLVDLRAEGGRRGIGGSSQGPTNLKQLLPAARVHRPAAAGQERGQSIYHAARDPVLRGANPSEKLLVLIDDGDGIANDLAETLRGQGNRRVVVLVGGEEILRRGGRSGLGRTGATFTIDANAVPELTNRFGPQAEREER